MDAEAFSAFYARTARSLWVYVYRVTRNATDADDILQEAFCRLLAVRLECDDEEQCRRYLYRIASNLMVDRWRHREREVVSDIDERSPDPALDPADRVDTLRTLARLAARERALLWLAYVEGHSHEEIARELGVAQRSVRVLLSRARKRLRAMLERRELA